MIDKAEAEFEKVRKRHSKHIKIATINFDKNMMLKNVDIQLKPTIHVYVVDFRKKSKEVQIDVGNAFQVSRADILNGSFANSFDGFYAYSGARGKLGLLMGLGYLFGSDIEMITPKFLGNIKTEGMNISTIGNAVEKDLPEIYEKKETAGRKTDTSPRQGGAGIGAAKRKKEEVVTWVFSVHEITGISERSGAPIFAKGIKVKVNRAYYDSAQNFVKSKYSYQKTGKHYFVELDKIER